MGSPVEIADNASNPPLWQAVYDVLGVTDPRAQDALAREAEVKLVQPGQSIISQDDREDQVFILLDGRARVVLLSESGQEIWLDDLERGAVVGEMAALTGRGRSSEIISETDCILAGLTAPKFLALIEAHGALGIALLRVMARRIQHTSQRMFELSAWSATGRIYSELLRIATPTAGGDALVIEPTPSMTELAARVNSTRETVSRTVNDLKRRGLLKKTKAGLELIDPDQLNRLRGSS